MEEKISTTCSCPCGKSSVTVTGQPFARFFCHCTICQSVYRAPFGDTTIIWANQVKLDEKHNINFKTYYKPPVLTRGTCASCGMPVVGYMYVAPFAKLAFIPNKNFPESYTRPDPRLHIFYDFRTADVNDMLPKYNGYWRSELAMAKLIASTAFSHGKR